MFVISHPPTPEELEAISALTRRLGGSLYRTLAPVEDKPIPQAESAFEGLKMAEGYAWGPGDIPMLTELLKVAKGDLYMSPLVAAVERKLLEVLGEPGAA